MRLWIAFLLAIGVSHPSAVDTTSSHFRGAAATYAAKPSLRLTLISDSVATHTRVVLAISEFFLEWQRLWRSSATLRAALARGADNKDLRLPYLHCHPFAIADARAASAPGSSETYARKFAQFSIVESDHSTFAACPSWILSTAIPDAEDERDSRDGALIGELRPLAQAARGRLLLVLLRAASESPASGFLSGQLVRFYLEQGETISARRAAQRCRAERWWCLALAAYVKDREGDMLEAEALYHEMQASQTPAERCVWQDAGNLLAQHEASRYEKLRCSDRTAALETLWWLSDPLYRIRGNERWVAHQSRQVDVALRSALDADERYAWEVARGGDAMARLITRYDWPTYTWWHSQATDENHSEYLFLRGSPPAEPYTTFEYSMDRVHLLPLWDVVARPFTATVYDWTLSLDAADGSVDPGWWSTEHFRTARRLVQLSEGQTVLLRRQSQIALATAHQLRHPLARADSLRFDVMLLSTTSSQQTDTLVQQFYRGGETTVMRSLISGTPTLLAVEALGSANVDARTRFGVQPPPTLNAMAPGEVAISEPALLSAESGAGDQRIPDDELLDHLLGSLRLEKSTRRFGVYWETYGIASRDTVSISVTMTGDATVSGVRRVGMALNVASDPNRSISIRWTEPSPQHYVRTLAGPVPAQLRSLMLNVEQLAPGPYILRISVERPGRPVVSSERRVVLEP